MFFEPSPGVLAIGEQTALGVAPIDTAGKSSVEVYRSIAPDRPVPQLLADAQARADEARRDRPLREAPSTGRTESFTANWFANNYCYNEPFFFINCHLGPNENGVTGDLDGTHADVDEFKTSMCVNSGKVAFRAFIEGDQHLGIQLTADQCWTYHWSSGIFNADNFRVTSTILSTSGNYFLAVKWNQ
jgi:hypothetical protein